MNNEITLDSFKIKLEEIKNIDENDIEFWYARELQKVLGYLRWENFITVIKKAQISCDASKININEHFRETTKTLNLPNSAVKNILNYKLTRYACYLIAMNGDTRKQEIAFAQTYFAVQTRKQELQEEEYDKLSDDERRIALRNEVRSKNSKLFDTVKNVGIESNLDFAIFNNFGYKGLYNGLDAKGIAKKKNIKNNKPILDVMGSTELAANLFRITQAEDKIKKNNIKKKPMKHITKLALL